MSKPVRDEHYATVVARASAHDLYEIFTNLEQYPHIFRFVRSVTTYGGRYSHWKARVLGYNTWEAVNDGWIANAQVGWRVTSGWGPSIRIHLQSLLEGDSTRIHVFIRYRVPGGLLMDLADELVLGRRFTRRLQEDLRRFALAIEKSPPRSIAPASPGDLSHANGRAASIVLHGK